MFVNEKDVSMIMEKFDKDRDGRISYTDYMEEIRPKSPMKGF